MTALPGAALTPLSTAPSNTPASQAATRMTATERRTSGALASIYALRMLGLFLVLPVFVLLLAAYLPGRIQRAARHPMLLAVKLWALAHLLANGTLADVLLFGGFLAWAVVDRISVKRRAAAGQLRAGPALPGGRANDAIALVGGLGIYVLFVVWAHAWLVGVRPFG